MDGETRERVRVRDWSRIDVRVIRHPTLAQCWVASGDGCPNKALRLIRGNHAQVSDWSQDALLRQIESNGVWGFANAGRREIEYWTDGRRAEEMMVLFFAHELDHIYPPVRAYTSEEHANRTGAIAAHASWLAYTERTDHAD